MLENALEQLHALTDSLGACYLNGKPAKLILDGRLPRVVARDGSESAVFNPNTVWHVVIRKGGKFITRDRSGFSCV